MEQDQQKRLLMAVVLSTALMFVWMYFIAPQGQGPALEDAGASLVVADAGAAIAAVPVPVKVLGDGGVVLAEAPVAPPIAERTVHFTTPAQDLTFSNKGGALQQAIIKTGGKWPESKILSRENDEKGKPAAQNMVRHRPGLPLPGSTELKGGLSLALDTMYEVEETKDAVTFRASTPEATLEKRYQLNINGYELRVEMSVTNRAAAPKNVTLSIAYPAWVDPKTQQTGGFFSPPPEVSQAICRHGNSNETLAGKKEATSQTYLGPVRYAGFDERYFMGVFFPRFAEGTSCTLTEDPGGDRQTRLDVDLGVVAPGQTVKREFGLFIGPKALQELQRVTFENTIGGALTPLGEEPKSGGLAAVDPELNTAIDFGWFAVFCRILLEVMKVFQKYVVNWGVAIVLLTVLVKLLLYPLSVKQMTSMEGMRKLQPQMDALTKKYEGDKEKLNAERMKLFSENKVNPFGGCLPLLIQMPVWIALYRTLLSSFELYREPLFSFWIVDLTAKDPYYILPLAMGVTMFITQKMQPAMGDPTQAKVMLYFMPIFFTFLMISLPAGLTLYIFTNNLLSIAQQKWIQHQIAKKKGQVPQKK